MANVLILGGGFGGIIAAEYLAGHLGSEHNITLISRRQEFLFYPDLVRLAFGKCEPSDISFDLREAMLDRRVRFVEGEIARIDPDGQRVQMVHGEIEADIPYDYLIVALGRRLATERVTGFFEHGNHLLTVEGALKFRTALQEFKEGRAIIGQCPGARLPVPVYETAFALSRMLENTDAAQRTRITIVSPDSPNLQFDDLNMARALRTALDDHLIEYLPAFPIERVTPTSVMTSDGHALNYGLLMLLPPFRGPGPVMGTGITDQDGYIRVDRTMKVQGVKKMYAVGDCVNFGGPKLWHMAVHQGQIAAANVVCEIKGSEPTFTYDHEIMLVIDDGGGDSIYFQRGLWSDQRAAVRQGRFWSWAKRIQQKYWLATHN